MSPMSPTRAMLACAWQARAAQGSNWLTWLLLGLTVLIPLVKGGITGQWANAIIVGAGIPLLLLSLLWYSLLFESLMQQTTGPMRMVPGVRRRAAIIFSAFYLLACPLLALFPAAAVGDYLKYLVWVLGFFIVMPLLSFVVSLPVRYFQTAGSHAHIRGTAPALKTQDDFVLAVLGPHARMDGLGVGAATFTLMFVVAAKFNHAFAMMLDLVGGTSIVAALLLAHYLFLGQLLRAVAATRLEQAQMRLASRAPGASELNRVLARVLLRQYGIWWLATSAAGLIAMQARGVDMAQVLAVMPILLLSLPGACWLLRDYARDLPGRGDWALGLLLLHNIGILLGIAVGKYEVLWLDGGLVLIIGTILAVTRWKSMCGARPAFPAGRCTIVTP